MKLLQNIVDFLSMLILLLALVPLTLRRPWHGASQFDEFENILHKVGLSLFAFLFVGALSGCGTEAPRKPEPLEDVVLAPPVEKVNIPKQTLEPCRPLPRMQKKAYTEAEMLAFENEVITIYDACRKRQKDLADTARKAFNLSK